MSDPLRIASGVLDPLTAATQSSSSLYQILQSFQDSERTIRTLRDELDALIHVLESLKAVFNDDDPILTPLTLPVRRCSQACQEFEADLLKCCELAGGTRASFRDWAKIKYLGGDIRDFTYMLAVYKSTIAIALENLNM